MSNKNFLWIDYDLDLLDVIKQNIEINDDVCNRERLEIQQFDWKQFNSDQIDNRIEILLAADGNWFLLAILYLLHWI